MLCWKRQICMAKARAYITERLKSTNEHVGVDVRWVCTVLNGRTLYSGRHPCVAIKLSTGIVTNSKTLSCTKVPKLHLQVWQNVGCNFIVTPVELEARSTLLAISLPDMYLHTWIPCPHNACIRLLSSTINFIQANFIQWWGFRERGSYFSYIAMDTL